MCRIEVWLIMMCCSWTQLVSQCTLDSNIVLNEVDTAHVIFEVEGAILNDLSDPAQGLCKVRIFFEHEFLGDLRAFLTSPAGQVIQLIGNEGNFGLTQFTEWNVCFIPSSQVANPDPGFADRWSNNQVWGAFAGIYSGSYYPFTGSLEDFNTGPVNGVWTLSFYDRTIFYESTIKEIELEFCDDTGLSCDACNPGSLVITATQINFCASDTIDLELDVDFSPNLSDSLDYDYSLYIIDQNGSIVQSGKSDSIHNIIPGSYTVCGLMYYVSDTARLAKVGDNWNVFLNNLNQGIICAVPASCQDIVIHPSSDTSMVEIALCFGDSLIIGGVNYDSTGDYLIPLTSRFGCDSLVDLRLEKVDFEYQLSVLDSFDCSTDSVKVQVISGTIDSSISISWIDEDGVILDTIQRDSIWIKTPGELSLIMEYRNCIDTLSINIAQDSSLPLVFLTGDTLSCFKDSVIVTALSPNTIVGYQWTQNGSPLPDNNDTIIVRSPGIYEVIIEADNGCFGRRIIEIVADTSAPEIMIDFDVNVCQEDSVPVFITATDEVDQIQWNGPNNFMSNLMEIMVYDTGWYAVSYRGSNGCIGTDSVYIEKLLSANNDSIEFFSESIECLKDGVITFRSSGRPLNEFQWIGPLGFLSIDTTFTSKRTGWYFFTFENADGCIGMDSLLLEDNRAYPNVIIGVDDLPCLGDTAYAFATSDSAIIDIIWVSPSGDTVISDSIFLNQNGTYHVTVYGSSGCIVNDSIQVDASNAPQLNLSADTLNCLNGKSVEIRVVSNQGNLIYRWFKDGRLSSVDSAFISEEGGLFILETQSPLGCDLLDSIQVVVDTLAPQVLVTSPDTITCIDSIAQIRAFSNPALVQYEWQGPQMFQSRAQNPNVNLPGIYNVRVTAVNGCVDSAFINVVSDTLLPVFNLSSDTITCLSPSIIIATDSTNILWEWQWSRPDSTMEIGVPVNSSLSGLHEVNVVNRGNGCLKMDSIFIPVDTSKIAIPIGDTLRVPCGEVSRMVFLPDTISYTEVEWIDRIGTVVKEDSVIWNTEGFHRIRVRGMNGCWSEKEVYLSLENKIADFDIEVDSITCLEDSTIMRVLNGSNLSSLVFIDPEGNRSQGDSLVLTMGGNVTLISTSISGCLDTSFYEVIQDTMLPQVILGKSSDLICDRESVRLQITPEMSTELEIQWSFEGQQIGGEPSIIITSPGWYISNVINPVNGCSIQDSIFVSDTGSVNIDPILAFMPPSCSEVSNGQITLNGVMGGVAPYRISFNGLTYIQIPVSWSQLRQAEHSLSIIDQNGCHWDTIIVFDGSQSFSVNAGRDTTIVLGEDLELNGELLPPGSADIATFWATDSTPSFAFDDLFPLVSPLRTTRYYLEGRDTNGCISIDDVIVFVKDEPQIFVPNIFSPNGDQVNDILEIYIGPGVKEIIQFQIFDRWGELVQVYSNVEPVGGKISWDGTLDGEMLVPGVFVYKMEVESVNNRRFLLSGTITMLH